MKTLLTQTCTIGTDTKGAPYYEIANVLGEPAEGDLPYKEVFLFSIVEKGNPKADAFLRIATLTDLTSNLARSYDAALAMNTTTYGAASMTVRYDNLTTAIAAKQTIQAKLDALISDYRAYTGKFSSPSEFTLPLAETSVVIAAKEALREALAGQADAQTLLDNAKTALVAAKTSADLAATAQAAAQARKDACTALCSQLQAVSTANGAYRRAFETLYAADATFLAQAQAHQLATKSDADFPTKIETFSAAMLLAFGSHHLAEMTVVTRLTTIIESMQQQCTQLDTELSQAKQARDQALTALSDAQAKVTLAERTLIAAQANADAALANIKGYCPLFDPAKDL